MVEDLYSAMNRDCLQTRCKGDDANVISSRTGLECLALAIEHDLCTNIGIINVCKEFDMLKVKVPGFGSTGKDVTSG